MAKNLMTELAKLLGVELGEEFIIENADRKENVALTLVGLRVIRPNNVVSPDHGKLLSKVLQGLYEVKKKPWEPACGEHYYCLNVNKKAVIEDEWWGYTNDYTLKALGMIYRTREEAEAHLAEDYERLTGKPLSSR